MSAPFKTETGNPALPDAACFPAPASSEEWLYRSLFESSPGLFVVLEPDECRIVAVSDDYLALTRHTRDEMLGKVFYEVFPDDPGNPAATGTANLLASIENVKNTLSKDVMTVLRHPILDPDTGALEDRFWAPMHTPVLDADGKLSLIIHRTEDVTDYMQGIVQSAPDVINRGELNVLVQARELKLLNDKLQESQQRLQAIFRDASLGIATTDLDGYFTDANAAYCSMLGYTLDELKQLNLLDLTHSEERTRSLDLRAQLKAGNRQSFIYEKRYISKSGKTVWSRINASLMRNSQGVITNLIAITEDITAQRNSEKALRQIRTLERLGGRIARVGGWVVEISAEGEKVYWAEETYDILEFSGSIPPPLEQLALLFTPSCRSQLLQAITSCKSSGMPFDLELQLTTQSGREKWLRIAAEAEFDSTGKISRINGATQDITRQKDEQKRSQQLSSQLFSTLESMSDAFYLLDSNYCFLYMNAVAENILGLKATEIIGKCIWDCAPYLKTTAGYQGYLHAMKTGAAYHAEIYAEPLQNWLSISAYPSTGGLAVYFRTTTKEKQLQSRLIESEQRLKHVTEAALDVAWEIDLLTLRTWFNDGLKKFGYDTRNQLMDSEFWESRVHPADAPEVVASLQAVLAGNGNEWSTRYRFRCSDNQYVHFEDRAYIMRDDKGRAVRILGGSTDVTKRIEMEEQLLQSQRLESIGQLTGGIAHDFNNLLTVILGNVQLLQEQLPEHSALQHLAGIIDSAATRGANLTRHLLAFSRKQALQPVALDLNRLLSNLKDMLARTLGENIIVRIKADANLWPAFIDENQLEVALLNLCINARDAMPHGGFVTLETSNIQLEQSLQVNHSDIMPGDYVVISITDTGSGIAADVIDHVFEPFFTTKENGKGTGLGLSTVFGFVKQSHGHINIYSEPGNGTTIRIYLPRSLKGAELSELPRQVNEIHGGTEMILLVEDNELVRKFCRDQLLGLGYRVVAAANGMEALAIIQERDDFELLFTDVVMPGMGGHELARLATRLRPGLKVLYASGYTQDSIIHNGKLDKGVHLLEKPYNRARLAAKLREVLTSVRDREVMQ